MKTTLFKSSELADWCGVDLKSIHNWVDKGRITAGKTPGGHLRFQPAEVARILGDLGVAIPQEVAAALRPDAVTS